MSAINLVKLLRYVRSQGYEGSLTDSSIYHNIYLNKEIIENIIKLVEEEYIDLFGIDIGNLVKSCDNYIDLRFGITNSSLKIIDNIDELFNSRTIFLSNFSLNNEFYLIQEDYYSNDDNQGIYKNLEKILAISKFFSTLFTGGVSRNLWQKFSIKGKLFYIYFSKVSYDYLENIDVNFINNFNIALEPYVIEKEIILKRAILRNVSENFTIDEIFINWKNILEDFKISVSDLIDEYLISEREKNLYNVKIEAIKTYNDIVSNIIQKSYSIPVAVIGSLITINQYTNNILILFSVFLGLVIGGISLLWSISLLDNIKIQIESSYLTLIDKNVPTYFLEEIQNSKEEMDKSLAKLDSLISFIKASIFTAFILVILILLSSTDINRIFFNYF